MPTSDPIKISPVAVYEPGMRKDANAVKLRLTAAGVKLDGLSWQLLNIYYNPLGFDFTSVDHGRIQQAAEKSPNFALDFDDMPGYDPWRQSNILCVGYSQLNTSNHLHLDVAVNRPGLCRVYVSPDKAKLHRNAMHMAMVATVWDSDTYKQIRKRLARLNPPLDIGDHIGGKPRVGKTPLDGVNFFAEDSEALITLLRNAKDINGRPAFAVGSKDGRENWPLNMSFLATQGVGFREIWRPIWSERPTGPSIRPMNPYDPSAERVAMDDRFGFNFDPAQGTVDLSALHCGVSNLGCNIHIDAIGFVMEDAFGNVVLTPNALRHTLDELVWKTNLKGKLPLWMLNNVTLIPPSSPLDFSRMGVSADFIKSKGFRVKMTGSCSVRGPFECSGTFSISGSHDLGSGH